MICIIMPTIGITPINEVTIPRTLPAILPFSLRAISNVTRCRMNITNKAPHDVLRINDPPISGIPRNASHPPVTHFIILDNDIIFPPFNISVVPIIPYFYMQSFVQQSILIGNWQMSTAVARFGVGAARNIMGVARNQLVVARSRATLARNFMAVARFGAGAARSRATLARNTMAVARFGAGAARLG